MHDDFDQQTSKIFYNGKGDPVLSEVLEQLDYPNLDMDKVNNNEVDFKAIIDSVTTENAPNFLKDLKNNMHEMLFERRLERMEFEERLYNHWKIPLDLLEMFIVMSYEFGDSFNNELRSIAAEQNDLVFEVLTRLHSRACLVAGEILTLLRSGYPSGAHSRWRTLHEIAVTALFVKEHGNSVAEKYLLHQNIESYKAMLQYQEYAEHLGQEPLFEGEVIRIKAVKEELCNRFGKCYGNNYGWAADTLEKCNPQFADIEKSIGLNHIRPYYKMASHAIHANPKGAYYDLGLSNSKTNILIAGPSNGGLADPGHQTAMTLLQINTTLGTHMPSIFGIIVSKAMTILVNEIGEFFLDAHFEHRKKSETNGE